MNDPGIPPARFTISPAARREIETLSASWNAASPDPAGGVWVSWAEWRPHAGRPRHGVFVTVYGRRYGEMISAEVQEVSGLPVLFTVRPDDAHRFDGKVVDFAAEQGFFLREP